MPPAFRGRPGGGADLDQDAFGGCERQVVERHGEDRRVDVDRSDREFPQSDRAGFGKESASSLSLGGVDVADSDVRPECDLASDAPDQLSRVADVAHRSGGMRAFTYLPLCLRTEDVREVTRPTRTRESFVPELDTDPDVLYISTRIYNQGVIDP